MPFEIFPQNSVLYPGDVQQFIARATPPPVLWGAFAFATLQSDGTLNLNTSNSDVALAHQRVFAGIAGIKWTFDSKMLPTGAGVILLRLIGGASHSLKVYVEAAVTTVKDENNNTIATIVRNVVSGDEYYLEIAGNVLRLRINGALSATYTAATPTKYPVYAQVEVTPPYAHASPHLTVPVMEGQWELDLAAAPSNTWTVAGGAVNDSTDLWNPIFTAGTSPGIFTLSVQASGSAYQVASTTILIPPLAITGPNAITLQPGEKVRFKTNYDAAQTKLVTWSIVSGGGAFSNDEFTAPTAPGTTVVRATYGNQRAEITITIPAIVTPTQTAATPGEQITFTTNMTGTTNWTADYGTPTSGSGSSFVWTAPNVAGPTVKIKADNGTFSKTIEIPVLLAFPYTDPALPLSWDRRKTVLVSRAEDRTRAARVKDKGALAFESFELSYKNRTTTELQTVHDFWDDHYPGKRFIFEDRLRDVRKVVYFDSDIRQEGNARCGIDYSFRVVEG